ncbi:hypothetical protein CgunFtcFv8_011822 [Champsocephalus gunnari]|uniref:Uncharacterized protein n=1 Tax=Champsocephalus gunnari TaxID=52237 RepID=A0AAN8D8P0_CHAGU|nr:hypothetical protein CgunFtcFv8_011822 [Champsocephalus gunnari]
MRPPTTVTMTL